MDRGAQGAPGNNSVTEARVSENGRYIAFTTWSSNLLPAPDGNGDPDLYWRDRRTGEVRLLSVDRNGTAAGAHRMDMSADGFRVAFASSSDSIVPGDHNGSQDVFVRDVHGGDTRRVSVSSAGREADKGAFDAEISDDGRRVAFTTRSTNLVPEPPNGESNVLVHDLSAGSTSAVIHGTDGRAPNSWTHDARLSGDGSVLLFQSQATNLVAGVDSGFGYDVYAVEVRSAGR